MKYYSNGITQYIQKNIIKSIVTITLTITFLIFIYPFLPHSPMPSTDVLMDIKLGEVRPQPIQNFVFIIFALIAPFYALAIALKRTNHQISSQFTGFSAAKVLFIDRILPFILAVLLFFPFFSFSYKYTTLILGENNYIHFPVLLPWLTAILLLLLFFLLCVYPFVKLGYNYLKINCIVILLVLALILLPSFGTSFITTVLNGVGSMKSHAVFACTISAIVSSIFCFVFINHPINNNKYSNIMLRSSWVIFIIAFMLQMLASRIVSIHTVTGDFRWYAHLEPVIYSISQAVKGKTLFVDFSAIYGWYSEILAPLFKVIGFSVFKLSIVFAIMQAVSMVAVFYILSKLFKNRLLLILTGLGLVMVTYHTSISFLGLRNDYDMDPYYQYWPIRFFWPAISIFAFYYFSIKKNLRRSMLVSLISALGLLWNFESGFAIILAYCGYLFTQLVISYFRSKNSFLYEYNRLSTSENFIALISHIGIVFIITSLFFGILSLKGHGALNWQWVFQHQYLAAAFGYDGISLLDYKDPWMIILGIYFIGLLISLVHLRWQRAKTKDDILCYISFLGIGTFVYYMSQSHTFNMLSASWPAFLISVILTDELLYAIRARILTFWQLWIPIVGVSFLFLGSARFISGVPGLIQYAKQKYSNRYLYKDQVIKSELEFIKEYSRNKNECVIIGKRSGIYYAELGIASATKGPEITSFRFKREQESLINQIVNGNFKCIFLGHGYYSDMTHLLPVSEILSKYKIVAQNPWGTMSYLQRME